MTKILNFSIVKAIIIRHIYAWRKDLDRVVDSFWWATIDLIFWGLTSNYLRQNNIYNFDITALFIGGIIFWVMVQNSQRDINMPLLDEAWYRNLVNLFTTPIRLREFITATLILGSIKLFLTISYLLVLAYIFYHYNIFRYGWYLLPAVINLIFVGWWIGFIINGLILRYGYKIQALAWAFIFVIYPFSAVVYPVSILPSWARIIASFIPTSYIFESMRSVLFSGVFPVSNIIISFTLNLFYLGLSLIFLNSSFKSALRNAKLVKLN